MTKLSREYWDNRYREELTGWDLKRASRPICEYIDQVKNKSLKILIPGGGYNYEAEYFFKNGFQNVYIVDYAQTALERFKDRNPDFPAEQLLCLDFFNIEGTFDLIIEQTFFCAINPVLRNDYVNKINQLLNDKGRLVGLLFNRTFENNPPYGGSLNEYKDRFKDKFEINKMELCYNSEPSRQGSELFINLKKV